MLARNCSLSRIFSARVTTDTNEVNLDSVFLVAIIAKLEQESSATKQTHRNVIPIPKQPLMISAKNRAFISIKWPRKLYILGVLGFLSPSHAQDIKRNVVRTLTTTYHKFNHGLLANAV